MSYVPKEEQCKTHWWRRMGDEQYCEDCGISEEQYEEELTRSPEEINKQIRAKE